MRKFINFPIERLKQLLRYDPDTGLITWITGKGNSDAGSNAGYLDNRGYQLIKVDGVKMKGHRVAFALHYGRWPSVDIDHANGIKSDNRICNLREATASQNLANVGVMRSSGTGYKGVSFKKRDRMYHARVTVMGKQMYLGSFRTAEEAHSAYCHAARKHFGIFARTS